MTDVKQDENFVIIEYLKKSQKIDAFKREFHNFKALKKIRLIADEKIVVTMTRLWQNSKEIFEK